jgi:hypothetical protein
VAAYLEARPDRWIDGREIQAVAGAYAWRTRLSNLRYAPWFMKIENRQRKVVTTKDGNYTVSEYRYVPEMPAREEERTEAAEEAAPVQCRLL